MPTDSKGSFHLNYQRMHAAERREKPGAAAPKKPMESHEPPKESEGVGHTTLHDHGDGSFHTETHDGERTEHPHIGHALMHMAARHSPDGKHMHVHQNEMGEHTSHHVGEDGEVQGPHDHANIEALKQHMGKFLDEESHESAHDAGGYGGHEMMAGI